MKKILFSLTALLALGMTACAPTLFPDMPDDKKCYNRIQEIKEQIKNSDSLDPETYASLNPEPYLSVLCARGKLRKVNIPVERIKKMRDFVNLLDKSTEIVYWHSSVQVSGFQPYMHQSHDYVTLYFWSKDTPQILAMLRRIHGK